MKLETWGVSGTWAACIIALLLGVGATVQTCKSIRQNERAIAQTDISLKQGCEMLQRTDSSLARTDSSLQQGRMMLARTDTSLAIAGAQLRLSAEADIRPYVAVGESIGTEFQAGNCVMSLTVLNTGKTTAFNFTSMRFTDTTEFLDTPMRVESGDVTDLLQPNESRLITRTIPNFTETVQRYLHSCFIYECRFPGSPRYALDSVITYINMRTLFWNGNRFVVMGADEIRVIGRHKSFNLAFAHPVFRAVPTD